MLGVEAYVMMMEEEDILRQMVRESEVEKEMSVLSAEGAEVEDRKPDQKELVMLVAGGAEAHGSRHPASSSSHPAVLPHPHQAHRTTPATPTGPHDSRLDDFAHHHHLTKTQVEGLFMVLGPHYSNPGRRAPLKDFVLTSLVVLSTKNNYRELNESKLFKSRGWMHKTIHQFCKMMVDHLSCLIEWPTDQYAKDTMVDFENIVGLPGVLGALDTCHMPITKAPVGQNSKTYSNPMLFHSIHLLAVADARSRFTYINVGRPGSFHESKVLERTSLYKVLESDPGSMFPPNSHLVADSAFPLMDQIITPYPVGHNLSREQKNFNNKVYSTRHPVDTAIELLRARWKRLKCLEMDEVQSMIQLVKTCSILHNICCSNQGYKDRNYEAEDKEDLEVEYVYVGAHPVSAMQKRDMLAMYMSGQTLTFNIQ